jgi:hypothetical protein
MAQIKLTILNALLVKNVRVSVFCAASAQETDGTVKRLSLRRGIPGALEKMILYVTYIIGFIADAMLLGKAELPRHGP